MNIDTGKATVRPYNDKDDIVLVDIYADGELSVEDIDAIHAGIEKLNLPLPIDTICVKSGKNYLSDEAFSYSLGHNCIHNKVIYVIKHMADIHFPSEAQETYFRNHEVDYCTSVDDAYYLLKKANHKQGCF